MKYLAWAMLLILQNASFTWVSRARNSSNYLYHAIAAIFSNGIWFASQIFIIDIAVKNISNPKELALIGVLYIVSTVSGSVFMHWVCMHKLEKK